MDVKAWTALPALALIALAASMPAYAQVNAKMLATEQGTLDVDFALEPDMVSAGEEARMNIDFVNPSTVRIQEHIDYHVTVSAAGEGGAAVKSVPLTHTSSGSVSIPVEFESDGPHTVLIGIRGILFQPIPLETVEFDVVVGAGAAAEEEVGGGGAPGEDVAGAVEVAKMEEVVEDAGGAPGTGESGGGGGGGGCLIATAAYGTEMAGQVQLLREVRDGAVMGTQAGAAFMGAFSHAYYAFSPAVADLERQSPALREAVRVGITPMLATLSLLDGASIDSDGEAVAYGLAVIMINAGMYAGIPTVAVLAVRGSARARRRRQRA